MVSSKHALPNDSEEPEWANVHYEKPDFQAISYYSAPKKADPNKTLDDVDPELLEMYKKLGISVDEQKIMNNVLMIHRHFHLLLLMMMVEVNE